MKQIDNYLEHAFRHAHGDPQEIIDAKLEMRIHLLDSINELKQSGLSEDEAAVIAIKRFGGSDIRTDVVSRMFHIQQLFAKRLLLIAVIAALATTAAAITIWRMDVKQIEQLSTLASSINKRIANEQLDPAAIQDILQRTINEQPHIATASLYPLIHQTDNNLTEESLQWEYDFNHPAIYLESKHHIAEWQLSSYGYHLNESPYLLQFDLRRLFSYIPIILSAGIAVYATLFTIWASINAYHHRRLNPLWIVVFACTNVPGYAIYLLGAELRRRQAFKLYNERLA